MKEKIFICRFPFTSRGFTFKFKIAFWFWKLPTE